MAEYHVGCGVFGIYAGTLNPKGTKWKNKSDVTVEAMSAVAQRLLYDERTFKFLCNGKVYRMKVEEVVNDE